MVIQSILKVFEGDLRAVSADIESLQQHSRGLAQQLSNRRVVRDAVANTIGRLIIPPDLIIGTFGIIYNSLLVFPAPTEYALGVPLLNYKFQGYRET